MLKSSRFVLFSRNQLRNSVLQKSSLFGFPQTECRICDAVLGGWNFQLKLHTELPPLPPAGWFTSSLAVAQSTRGHCRHVATGSKFGSIRMLSMIVFTFQLPAKLAFVPSCLASSANHFTRSSPFANLPVKCNNLYMKVTLQIRGNFKPAHILT